MVHPFAGPGPVCGPEVHLGLGGPSSDTTYRADFFPVLCLIYYFQLIQSEIESICHPAGPPGLGPGPAKFLIWQTSNLDQRGGSGPDPGSPGPEPDRSQSNTNQFEDQNCQTTQVYRQ